jgi:hypothetical protein
VRTKNLAIPNNSSGVNTQEMDERSAAVQSDKRLSCCQGSTMIQSVINCAASLAQMYVFVRSKDRARWQKSPELVKTVLGAIWTLLAVQYNKPKQPHGKWPNMTDS